MSRSRNRRYYDDSDDMVERIRRAREAFEKKANAFQGPDWPFYDKRIIVGKKKKEDGVAAEDQPNSTVAPAGSDATANPPQLNTESENAAVTTADQTASWWAAQREAPTTSTTVDAKDQSNKATNIPDDKASS
jgi:hypothetical protein